MSSEMSVLFISQHGVRFQKKLYFHQHRYDSIKSREMALVHIFSSSLSRSLFLVPSPSSSYSSAEFWLYNNRRYSLFMKRKSPCIILLAVDKSSGCWV